MDLKTESAKRDRVVEVEDSPKNGLTTFNLLKSKSISEVLQKSQIPSTNYYLDKIWHP